MRYLVDRNIVHRNLSASNVLVGEGNLQQGANMEAADEHGWTPIIVEVKINVLVEFIIYLHITSQQFNTVIIIIANK